MLFPRDIRDAEDWHPDISVLKCCLACNCCVVISGLPKDNIELAIVGELPTPAVTYLVPFAWPDDFLS